MFCYFSLSFISLSPQILFEMIFSIAIFLRLVVNYFHCPTELHYDVVHLDSYFEIILSTGIWILRHWQMCFIIRSLVFVDVIIRSVNSLSLFFFSFFFLTFFVLHSSQPNLFKVMPICLIKQRSFLIYQHMEYDNLVVVRAIKVSILSRGRKNAFNLILLNTSFFLPTISIDGKGMFYMGCIMFFTLVQNTMGYNQYFLSKNCSLLQSSGVLSDIKFFGTRFGEKIILNIWLGDFYQKSTRVWSVYT